ncbi:MAG TPA: hypothetical protein VIU15_03055 [Streptomyces sp.]
MNAPEHPQPEPEIGALFLDVSQDRIGEYRGEWAGRWALRPLMGGLEWEARPGDVRPVTAEQALRAKVEAANRRSRRGIT